MEGRDAKTCPRAALQIPESEAFGRHSADLLHPNALASISPDRIGRKRQTMPE